MTELEAVYARHSVRSYLDRRIEPDKLRLLNEKIADCNRRGRLRMTLLEDAAGTFGRLLNRAMGLSSAPSAIACAGTDDATLDERVGYYGEQIVLYAQTLGLNTCWAGTFSAKRVPLRLAEGERLVIVIAVGYGAQQGKAHRSKPIEQLGAGSDHLPAWFAEGLKLAALAPTAINQQKFEFHLNDDGTVEAVDRGGPFSRVDLGIVKYHFDLGRASAGRSETFPL